MATITGTPNNDLLTGTTSNDILNGLGGNDRLLGSRGNDTLNGGAGIDTADYSSLGQTIVLGVAGTVTKEGGFGTDQLNGIETITASNLLGDKIDASAATGSASIRVDLSTSANNLSVNNVLINGVLTTLNFTVNNFENVTGTNNNDSITGNSANNILIGGAGNDTLRGGAGNDALVGGAGNDILRGGAGNDVLIGGAGNDQFRFLSRGNEGVDTITDFALGDKLVFSASGFGGGLVAGPLSPSQFVLGSSATNGSQRFIYNNGNLFFDVDGNGSAAQQLIANLSGSPNVTSQSFQIIA